MCHNQMDHSDLGASLQITGTLNMSLQFLSILHKVYFRHLNPNTCFRNRNIQNAESLIK